MNPTTLQEQAKALGDPTRHAIFRHIAQAGRAVGIAELNDQFPFNHNAIRQHLAKLRDAALLIEERGQRSGPGRPPLLYRPVPGAVERWEGAGPYEALSMMLIDVLRGEGTPLEVGRKAGRELADQYGADGDTLDILDAVARRMGFEPQREQTECGADVVLDRCPFVGPASAAPDIVCDLHRGISEGIALAAQDDADISDLVVRPPASAGCRIQVSTAEQHD